MEFLGKLKSAIKGNPVIKEYELGKQVASAGTALMWKVHAAIKKTTRQEVSVFLFNKQTPEIEKLPKKRREAIFEMLRRCPTNLARLRHPQLLTIEHQVEETSDVIAFATEPVFACLANVLGHYENLPSPLPLSIKEHQLHPIEAHYGLMQVAEALSFLHSDAKMMHGNLTPECVVLNKTGQWKVMGMNFASFVQYQTSSQCSFNFKEWDNPREQCTNPSLDYLAPEYIMSEMCSSQSDLYSFGMLVYSVYNGGVPLMESRNNILTFKHNVEQISRITEAGLGGVPAELRTLVKSLLVIEPSVRPDALQVTKSPFFDEVQVSTLRYLDTLYQKSDIEKSQFFKKTLSRIITKFPKRVIYQRVLPALNGEFRNHRMIPFILPIVLLVAEDCSLQDYSAHILPILIPAFKVQDPIQVSLIFLQKMDLILKKTAVEEMKQHILPMILRSLESNSSQVQELCVSILPTFVDMVDYSSMKHSIIPRITFLCLNTESVGLCVKCLLAIGQMLEVLDKHMVLEQVLPTVVQIKSREPGVLMGILGIFHTTLTNKKLGFDKLYLGEKVIPFLIPLSLESSLNLTQFNQFMAVIREMLKQMETEQQAHLKQLSKMEEQTRSTVEYAREVMEAKVMEDALTRIDAMSGENGVPPQEAVLPSRGSSVPVKTTPTSAPTSTVSSDDLFSGLNVDLVSSSTPPITHRLTTPTTTASSSTAGVRIDFKSHQQTPPTLTTPTYKQQLQPQPATVTSPMPRSSGSPSQVRAGYSAPTVPLQPTPTPATAAAGGGGGGGMGWSSSLLTPSPLVSQPQKPVGSSSTLLSSANQTTLLQPIKPSSASSTWSTSSTLGWSGGESILQPTLSTGSWGATPTPPVQEPRLQPSIPHSTQRSSQLGSGMGWSANIAAGHTNTASQWNSGSGAVSSLGTTGGMGTGPLLIPSLSSTGNTLVPQQVGGAQQDLLFPLQPTPGDNPFADNNNSLL